MYVCMTQNVTTTISPEFKVLCQKHRIPYCEALRTGIAIMLAEKDVQEYDNKLILHRKMKAYQAKVEELSQRLNNGQSKKEDNR
ncbi:MAG: hypothetical protein CMI54_00765 [Parcubacteria group bacterium]|nr:hypothetical protein [Parcubacteria group bacterium]